MTTTTQNNNKLKMPCTNISLYRQIVGYEETRPTRPSVHSLRLGMAAHARPIGAEGRPSTRSTRPEHLTRPIEDAELARRQTQIVRYGA